MIDWPSEIVRGVLIQQRIEALDQARLWRRYLPEVAATEVELRQAEQRLGHPIEPQYRAFLAHANGWRWFYQAVDLFGTQQLLGASPMEFARLQLGAVEGADFVAAVGMSKTDVLPIGASGHQGDLFLLAQPWSHHPGTVSWYTGQLIERYPNFDEFFLAMLDYNREEIRSLEEEARRPPG
jgi:hypothetical protein